MGVRDRLIDQRAVAVVRETMRAQSEDKAEQLLGSDSLNLLRVKSNSAYDVTFSLSGYESRVVGVTYTPDSNSFGGAAVYRLYVNSWTISGPRIRSTDTIIERQRTVNGVHKWRVTFTDSTTIWAKFYFATLGSGNFAMSVLS